MKKFLLLFVIAMLSGVSLFADNHHAKLADTPYKSVTIMLVQEDPEIEVEIFPNPVTDGRLTIKADNPILSVQVLNITGKIVANQDVQPGTYTVVLELYQAEKGLYLVRVKFENDVIHTEKIMVK